MPATMCLRIGRLAAHLRSMMQQKIPKTLETSIHLSGAPDESQPGSLIRLIEELSLNAWPSLQTVHYDGWVLRFADGYTRRANSINPVFSSSLNIDDKIKYCEDLFRTKQRKVVFKMTPQVYPENLDDILARKWYREETPTTVQTLDLAT